MILSENPQSKKIKDRWSIFKNQLFPYTRNEQPEKKISTIAHKKLEKLSLNLANLILK